MARRDAELADCRADDCRERDMAGWQVSGGQRANPCPVQLRHARVCNIPSQVQMRLVHPALTSWFVVPVICDLFTIVVIEHPRIGKRLNFPLDLWMRCRRNAKLQRNRDRTLPLCPEKKCTRLT